MSAPDVEALLREHRLMYDVLNWTCRCGKRYRAVAVPSRGRLTIVQDLHDAHQAAIITAAYAETLAGARTEAAEAKLARVEALAEQWGSWESPYQPPLIPRGAASRLRAALADPETEA